MNKLTVVTSAFALFLYMISSTTIFQAAAQIAAQEPIQAGHTHDVIRVKWSPDDERFISYSGGGDYIRLWEVKTARVLWSARTTFIQQKDEHYALTNFAWSPDQALIASGSGNGMIQIWDAQTGKLRWNVRAHAEHVNTLVFSSDGKYLVSSGLDENDKNEIRTWNVVSGSLIRKFKADPGVVIAILVNEDGTRLLDYLYHPEETVRRYAANSLGYWPDDEVQSRLNSLGRDKGLSDVFVDRTLSASPELAEAMFSHLGSDNPVIVRGALTAASRVVSD